MLRELSKATKWTPNKIAENTGMSVSWVRKYLPQEFKNLEMSTLAHKRTKSNNHSCPKCSSSMVLLYCCTECGEMHSTQIIKR
jgi:hypothetical protein